MKIKVCGLREPENIAGLYDAGVRMMGFIFYEKSKRFIDQEKRREVFNSVPKEVKKVGVFVNESEDFVLEAIQMYNLDYVQLHGEETPQYCERILGKAKVIKAFRVDDQFDFSKLNKFQMCDYFLFDAKGKEYGGNGIKYNWDLLRNYKIEIPFLLSGGIESKDANEILAIQHAQFAGVDINSGFEIQPGLKNIEEVKKFISNLKCSTQ